MLARLQGVGVPGDLCSAALPLTSRKTALALAVRCGAAATAAALVAAGAATARAFPQLVELAKWKAQQLGPEAAAAAVPALVQQCAAALLAAPTDDWLLADVSFAAARLAFPHDMPPVATMGASCGYPPCPWLHQQLLQRHQAGEVRSPPPVVGTACDALADCAGRRSRHGPHDQGELGAALAAWLSLPAAASIPADRLASLLRRLCECGLTAPLPPLLDLEPVQAALRAEAARPLALKADEVEESAAIMFAAASSGRGEVLDAVLAAGGAVTLNAIRSATLQALDAAADAAVPQARRVLRLLLSRGRPAVPADVAAQLQGLRRVREIATFAYLVCPIYTALNCFCGNMGRVRAACRPFPAGAARVG